MRWKLAWMLIILSVVPRLAGTVGLVPREGGWRYLQSVHFRAYYLPGQETYARQTIYQAEEVHARLIPFLRWLPFGRTNLIIADHTDIVNDFAAILPKRTIIIYPSQDAGGRHNYAHWLREVLFHEYTHILQMDMQRGIPAGFNSLFGRLFLPNAIQPMHQIEGLAVYSESRFTGLGRNESAYTKGILRAAACDSTWPSLDRAGVHYPGWPPDAAYLYGGRFHKWLAATRGQTSLAKYQRMHSGLVFPWLHNLVAREVYGRNFDGLWRQWQVAESAALAAESSSSLDGSQLTPLNKLTDSGFDKSGLATSPDGKYLAYLEKGSHERPRLILRDLTTGKINNVDRGFLLGRPAFSLDGSSLAYAKMEYQGTGNRLFGDLYLLTLHDRRINRLTRGARARDPAFMADGQIYFVTSRMGQNALACLDTGTRQITQLTDFDGQSQLVHLAASPNGLTLAVSVWQEGGYQNIWLYSATSREWRPLTFGLAQDLSPCWSPDGGAVFFASDRSGIWNIYHCEVGEAKLTRLTNSATAVFDPAPSGDSLFLLSLGPPGLDLSTTPIRQGLEWQNGDVQGPDFEINRDTSRQLSSGIYRPWTGLTPFLWLPKAMVDQQGWGLGATLYGSDDLLVRTYSATMVPSFKSDRIYYDLACQDRSRPVYLGFKLSDMVASRQVSWSGQDTTIYQVVKSRELICQGEFVRTGFSLQSGVEISWRGYSGLPSSGSMGGNLWRLTRLGFPLVFSNVERYGYSISPERGRLVKWNPAIYLRRLGGQLEQTHHQLGWTEFRPGLGRHQVLMAQAQAGWWAPGTRAAQDAPSLTPRCLASRDQRGQLLLTAEYRFPIKYVERGISTWPIFLKNFNGAMVAETGTASEKLGGIARDRRTTVLGVELTSEWLLSYAMPGRFTIGFYRQTESEKMLSTIRISSGDLWPTPKN